MNLRRKEQIWLHIWGLEIQYILFIYTEYLISYSSKKIKMASSSLYTPLISIFKNVECS